MTAQNRHLRVHVSPRIRKVAVPQPQHSAILGHLASSHTVCKDLLRIKALRRVYVSPETIRTLIQSGLRSSFGDAVIYSIHPVKYTKYQELCRINFRHLYVKNLSKGMDYLMGCLIKRNNSTVKNAGE